MPLLATITGPISVVTEGPIFRALFPVNIHGDNITAGLVGDRGRIISKNLQAGDLVGIEGHFITEKTFGKVFVIEWMHLDEEANKGRNLNVVV